MLRLPSIGEGGRIPSVDFRRASLLLRFWGGHYSDFGLFRRGHFGGFAWQAWYFCNIGIFLPPSGLLRFFPLSRRHFGGKVGASGRLPDHLGVVLGVSFLTSAFLKRLFGLRAENWIWYATEAVVVGGTKGSTKSQREKTREKKTEGDNEKENANENGNAEENCTAMCQVEKDTSRERGTGRERGR